MMKKNARLDYPINHLSQNRWSPRAFDSNPVEKEKLRSIFEAARWSASAYNDQPWRFLVAFSGDENFEKIFQTLVVFNKNWAAKAPVLILNCYQTQFKHNGTTHTTAQYDLGQAVASYSLEALNQGLYVHQMTGFDAGLANNLFGFGKQTNAFSVSALGYLGNPTELIEDLMKLETSERQRLSQNEFLLNEF